MDRNRGDPIPHGPLPKAERRKVLIDFVSFAWGDPKPADNMIQGSAAGS
jgi:hypothetical protein